jgi:hypothetical protein
MRFTAAAERECGHPLRTFRTDRGGEFTSTALGSYFADLGVQRHLTAPYSPQQNGVVERRNQTVVGMARSMLKAKRVPLRFCGEAVYTAVYVLNRSYTRAVDGQTPFEAWYGRKPDVEHLRTFGCVAYAKVTRPGLKKLEDRSIKTVFLGYEPGSKGYRLYDPVGKRMIVSRDVVFDEGSSWDWSHEEQDEHGELVVEYMVHGGAPARRDPGGEPATPSTTASPPTPPSNGPPAASAAVTPAGAYTEVGESSGSGPAPSVPTSSTGVEFVSPPDSFTDTLDDGDDPENPHRFRMVADLMDKEAAAPPQGRCLFLMDEPESFDDAVPHECWRQAMLDELASIEENDSWTLTDLPPGHRPIGLKWVFKTKKDAAGVVVKHKARLVAKGYVQREGVDFDDVFAHVARLDSVRLLVGALAAAPSRRQVRVSQQGPAGGGVAGLRASCR